MLSFHDDQDLGISVLLRCGAGLFVWFCFSNEHNHLEMKQDCLISVNRYSKPKGSSENRSLSRFLNYIFFWQHRKFGSEANKMDCTFSWNDLCYK